MTRGGRVAARHVVVFGRRRAGFVAGLVQAAEELVGLAKGCSGAFM